MRATGILLPGSWGRTTGRSLWKTGWQLLTKLNIIQPSHSSWIIYPTDLKHVHRKSLSQTSDSSVIHDHPKLEAINRWTSCVSPDNGTEYHSAIRNELSSHKKMGVTPECSATWVIKRPAGDSGACPSLGSDIGSGWEPSPWWWSGCCGGPTWRTPS